MNKLKVLCYGDYINDCSGFGKILHDLIPIFLEEGHEVRQVALRYSGLYQHKHKEIIPIYPTQIRGVGNYWAPEVLDYAIDEFNPDIIFSLQDYFVLPYLTQVISKPRKSLAKWIHYGVQDGMPFPEDVAYAAGWVNYHCYMSKFAKKVVNPKIKNSEGEVVYPPIELKNFKRLPDKEKVRKNLKLDQTFNVLFVGRNQFRKNFPALMEAIKKVIPKIPNVRLIYHSTHTLTPEGQPAGYDIGSIAKTLEVNPYIAHIKTEKIDVVPENMINQLYNIADCLVLPTYAEGFGLPLVEAMAAGCPTIGTDCSSVTEVIGDRGILVPPAANLWVDGKIMHKSISVDKLADAIYKMRSNKIFREECIDKGLEFVKQLAPEIVGKKLLKIFNKVIDENIKPHALKTNEPQKPEKLKGATDE